MCKLPKIENKIDILSLSLEELKKYLQEIGEKAFRGTQIFSWLHEKRVTSFAQMTNLSKNLREQLESDCILVSLEEIRKLESKDGTIKYLLELHDGHVVESVFMRYKHGNSICISSQVGCRMGCKFCASTIGGLERNLSASEMLGQIYAINRLSGQPISNIVIMGTGEPLDNYDALLRFIQLATDRNGMDIANRNITVSTCGIVPKILELAKEKLQITLAISLHAPDNTLRKTMMPVAGMYGYEELLQACKEYVAVTGRRITFEYSLVRGVNDSVRHGAALAKVLQGMLCHVNLIPINPIEERGYQHSRKEEVLAFKKVLEKHGVQTTVRRELGSDIDAACGQLRRSYTSKKNKEK